MTAGEYRGGFELHAHCEEARKQDCSLANASELSLALAAVHRAHLCGGGAVGAEEDVV